MTATSSETVSAVEIGFAAKPINALGRAGERLRRRLGDVQFRAWFRLAWIENNTGETVRIAVPTRFVRDWLHDRYLETILDCFQCEDPACRSVEIVIRER